MCGSGQSKHLICIKMDLVYSSYKINLSDDVVDYSLALWSNAMNIDSKGNQDNKKTSHKVPK